MSIQVHDDLITHIASLARLALSESERQEIRGHFENVLRYVESLDRLDTSSLDPSIFAHESVNVLEPDEPHESPGQEAALRNAPDSDGECFIVPRIISEASDAAGPGAGGEGR